MSRSIVIVLLVVAVPLVMGCRGTHVKSIDDAPVTTTSGNAPSLSQVGTAIVQAGVGLGWGMRVVSPGHISGSLNLRSHTAVVDITFDTQTYSINYKDSTNLKYDEEKGTIHKNYNSWVQNLHKAIQSQLVSL